MASSLDPRARELVQARNFAHVTTMNEDGSPHVTLTWVDLDGDQLLLNSAEGRRWPANLRRDPRVTITVANLENLYEYVSVRGRLAEATHEGADEHIDRMARKYFDQETYPFRQPGEQRILLRIAPERARVVGG
jgi:PPOX class probable F420-dependent enzyme